MKNQMELDVSRMLGFKLGNSTATGSKVGGKVPPKYSITTLFPAKIGSKDPRPKY